MNSVEMIVNAATVNPISIEDAILIKDPRFLMGRPNPILDPRYVEIATTTKKGPWVLWFGSSVGSVAKYIKQLMAVAETIIRINFEMLACKVFIAKLRQSLCCVLVLVLFSA